MVGCAMRTKMPTGRYFHGARGAPYALPVISKKLFFALFANSCALNNAR